MRTITIIGGGLAGLGLGLGLRKSGVPVVIHEAGAYPRGRVCGEFIAGLAEETIETLGLAPHLRSALPIDEVRFLRAGNEVTLSLPQPALSIGREDLDTALAQAFREAGGELQEHSRQRPEILDTPPPGTVIATGSQGKPDSRWIGLREHRRSSRFHRELWVELGQGAYVGASFVDRETINICGLFPRRGLRGDQLLGQYLEATGVRHLRKFYAESKPVPGGAVAVAGLNYRAQPTQPGQLRLGDATGLIPPFTGAGMALALTSAAAVLEPLARYSREETTWQAATAAAQKRIQKVVTIPQRQARLLHPLLYHRVGQRALLSMVRLGFPQPRSIYAWTRPRPCI